MQKGKGEGTIKIMSLKIIVAGGLGALGRAVCADLSKRGNNVAAVDLAPAPESFGCLAFGGVDLADEAAVAAAYGRAAEALGGAGRRGQPSRRLPAGNDT